MKTHVLPSNWSGDKFASRYGLNTFKGEFYIGGDSLLYYPDFLPDEPIFEAPDTPQPPIPTLRELLQRIEALERRVP